MQRHRSFADSMLCLLSGKTVLLMFLSATVSSPVQSAENNPLGKRPQIGGSALQVRVDIYPNDINPQGVTTGYFLEALAPDRLAHGFIRTAQGTMSTFEGPGGAGIVP